MAGSYPHSNGPFEPARCVPPDRYLPMCPPRDANLGVWGGVLGVFWGCSGGCSGGVLGVFWGCPGGIRRPGARFWTVSHDPPGLALSGGVKDDPPFPPSLLMSTRGCNCIHPLLSHSFYFIDRCTIIIYFNKETLFLLYLIVSKKKHPLYIVCH